MNSNEENKAVQMIAKGDSQEAIAKELGVSQSTVSRFKESHKELIQRETEKLLKSLPDITEQLLRDVSLANKVSKALNGEIEVTDLPSLLSDTKVLTKFMELSYKKQSDILKAMGIYPTQTPSVFIQNIFQSGSQAVISPNIMTVLGEHLKKTLIDSDVVDAEVVS